MSKKPFYTYADLAQQAGTTKSKLQAFCRHRRQNVPAFATPCAQVIVVKAKADAFDGRTANTILAAWKNIGPGRKK